MALSGEFNKKRLLNNHPDDEVNGNGSGGSGGDGGTKPPGTGG